MILHQNNPIITDIFLRAQDKKTLVESINEEEMEGLIRRYVTQVKQAVNDYETKFEKRIRSLRVVSNVPKIDHYLGKETVQNIMLSFPCLKRCSKSFKTQRNFGF